MAVELEDIFSECDRIDAAIADMKLAISEKGITVPEDATISNIASLVFRIPAGIQE